MRKRRIIFSRMLDRMTIAMMVAISALFVAVIFPIWTFTMNSFAARLIDEHDIDVRYQLDDILQTAMMNTRLGGAVIEEETVDMGNALEREAWFARSLNVLPAGVFSYGFGTANGEYYGARRDTTGEIQIMRNNGQTGGKSIYYEVDPQWRAGPVALELGLFDARTRPWYKAAADGNSLVFSPLYTHFVLPELVISAALPVHDASGRLSGVLASHIVLNDLNARLAEISSTYGSEILILERSSRAVVANSRQLSNLKTGAEDKLERISLNEMATSFVISGIDRYFVTGETSTQGYGEGGYSFLRISRFEVPGIDWLIVATLPTSKFARNMNYAIGLALMLLVVMAFVFRQFWKRMNARFMKPVMDLVEAAEALSAGNRSRRIRPEGTEEFVKLSAAFNRMADELERQLESLEEKVRDRTTELEEAYTALMGSRDNLQLILDSTAEAIFGVDLDGRCTFANARFAEMSGCSDPGDLAGLLLDEILVHATPKPVSSIEKWDWSLSVGSAEGRTGDSRSADSVTDEEENLIKKALRTGETLRQEQEILRRSDGTVMTADISCYPQFMEGVRIGAVISMTDITQRKKDESDIRWLSYHDQLTGLYNRRFFEESLEHEDNPRNWPLTILMVDMNGLKMVNDALGHVVGDRFLRHVSDALRHSLRADDLAARVGGDEFVALLPNADEHHVEKIMHRIEAYLRESVHEIIPVSVSIGYAVKRTRSDILLDVVKKAEESMYRQKLVRSPAQRSQAIRIIMQTLYEELPEEEEHGRKVGWLAASLGRELQLEPAEIDRLHAIGQCHDIGMIAIRRDVLLKAGSLDEEERAEIMRHAEIGYRILSSSEDTQPYAEVVLSHHEQWDGNGYPRMTKGMDIPKPARLLHLAEAYVSMTTSHPWAAACSHEEAILEIQAGAGRLYDPTMAAAMVRMLSAGPPNYLETKPKV